MLSGMRLLAEPRREGEGASTARLALHADRPTHQADKTSGDAQAQTGTTIFPGRGRVHLFESAEDLLPSLRRDADAGVGDRDAKDSLRFQRLAVDDVHPYGYLTLLGELDRIADQ